MDRWRLSEFQKADLQTRFLTVFPRSSNLKYLKPQDCIYLCYRLCLLIRVFISATIASPGRPLATASSIHRSVIGFSL